MKTILGLDIGGANTKAALMNFQNGEIIDSFSYIEYYPFWEKSLNGIPNMLSRVLSKITKKARVKIKDINYFSIAITAELSDAFKTKKEGILIILNALSQVLDQEKLRFISNNGDFLAYEEAKKNFASISGANWVSTSIFLSNFISKCILIDAGSTTIDIIPILNSLPVAKGKNDIERLMNHELIYTGGLRATIPSISHFVPYKGSFIRISFEKFALVSDIHRILYNISEDEYINDTADNRSKSIDDCYARLARIICMDIDTISKDDLNSIAKYIYQKQLELISTEIQQFLTDLIPRIPEFKDDITFVITGIAAEFLIRRALLHLGYINILNYEELTKISDSISSSAFAVAGALYFKL
ncbi:MAG: hydantoinase/oxoprolinase family protein [Candidatus Hodarchaeota archaeon]